MSTDPFVAPELEGIPRQIQNLAPGVRMPAARPWYPNRPAEVRQGQPTGPFFGAPGPDVGYALTLVHRVADTMRLAEHEHREDAIAVVGELAMKRAALFGRAPVATDVECAMLALGYDGTAAPEFAAWRARAFTGAAHEYGLRRAICDAVPLDLLRLPPGALATRTTEVHQAVRAALSARRTRIAG
jgi:hypothetical protein